MSDPTPEPAGPPPETGHHDIDRALASLELGDDVAAHPERIATALDAVQRALAAPAVPQALRPNRP